jgi:hypothetical protein
MSARLALLVLLIVAGCAADVYADVPVSRPWWKFWERGPNVPPPHPAPVPCPFLLRVSEQTGELRLDVPRKLAKNWKVAGLTPTDLGPDGSASTRTLIAGISLSTALACGGYWLVRRRPGFRQRFVLAGMVAALFLIGVTAWGDIPPGHTPIPTLLPRLPPPDGVFVNVIDQGDFIVLTVGRDKWEQFVKESAPKP